MTFDKNYFIKFKLIRGKVYLAGRDNVVEFKGIGTIKVKVQDDKGKINYVIMYDVVYVLYAITLFVMKLMDRELEVISLIAQLKFVAKGVMKSLS